jgi:hypothetical protein
VPTYAKSVLNSRAKHSCSTSLLRLHETSAKGMLQRICCRAVLRWPVSRHGDIRMSGKPHEQAVASTAPIVADGCSSSCLSQVNCDRCRSQRELETDCAPIGSQHLVPNRQGGFPNCWKLLRVLTFDDHWALDGFDLRTVAGVWTVRSFSAPRASLRTSPYTLRTQRGCQSNELFRPPYSKPSHLIATWRRYAAVTTSSLAL